MHKIISVDDIENAKNKTLSCVYNENLDGLNLIDPIYAELTFKSLGDFIEVSGNVKGNVKLECDLCLEEFVYDLDFVFEDVYAKHALIEGSQSISQEVEIKKDQFVVDLNGENQIDVYDLLYQYVILNLPNKKVCGINCKGRDKFLSKENIPDPRLDVFKNIKIN